MLSYFFNGLRPSKHEAHPSSVATSEGQLNIGLERLCRLPHYQPGQPVQRISDDQVRQVLRVLRILDTKYGRTEWAAWSSRPRTYIILWNVNGIELMNNFVRGGYTDYWLPYDNRTLPGFIESDIMRQRFLLAQNHLLTSAKELEDWSYQTSPTKVLPHIYLDSSGDQHFLRISTLGQGGFGVVDEVWSLLSLQQYARKRVVRGRQSSEANRRAQEYLVKELMDLKSLSHRHLVKVFGSYTDPEYIAFLMRPVAECNLHDFLRRPGGLTDRDRHDVRKFFGCLAGAVHYLHDRNIRHRDLSSRNVLICQGAVYISDLGSAHKWTNTATHGSMTQDRNVPASVEYMAPEVARRQPRSSSSDMWSLGVVYLELATLLVGRTLDQFQTLVVQKAGRRLEPYIWANPSVVNLWVDKLQQSNAGPRHDNEPLGWIRDLLQESPKNRPKSRSLMQDILECPSFNIFCCIKCQPEFRDRRFAYDNIQPIQEEEAFDNPTNMRDNIASIFKKEEPRAAMSTKKSASIEHWLAGTETIMPRQDSPMMPGSFGFDDTEVVTFAASPPVSEGSFASAVEDNDTDPAEPAQPPLPPPPDFESLDDTADNDSVVEPIELLGEDDLYPHLEPIKPRVQSITPRPRRARDTGLGFLEYDSSSSSDDGEIPLFNETEDSSGSDSDSEATVVPAKSEAGETAEVTSQSLPTFAGEENEWLQALDKLPNDEENEVKMETSLAIQAHTEESEGSGAVVERRTSTNMLVICRSPPQETTETRTTTAKAPQLASEASVQKAAQDKSNSDLVQPLDKHDTTEITTNPKPCPGKVDNDSQAQQEHQRKTSIELQADQTQVDTGKVQNAQSSVDSVPPTKVPLERLATETVQHSGAAPKGTATKSKHLAVKSPKAEDVKAGSKPVDIFESLLAFQKSPELSKTMQSSSNQEASPSNKSKPKIVNKTSPLKQKSYIDEPVSSFKQKAPEISTSLANNPGISSPATESLNLSKPQSKTQKPSSNPSKTPSIPPKVPSIPPKATSITPKTTSIPPKSHPVSPTAPPIPESTPKNPPTMNWPSWEEPISERGPTQRSKRLTLPGISASDYIQDTWESASSVATSVMSENTSRLLKNFSLNKWLDKDHGLLETFCSKGNVAAVRVLLEKGCNPGRAEGSKQGRRIGPIFNAIQGASMKHNKCVNELLAHEADVNVRSRKTGKTPLHVAIENPYFRGYEHLIRNLIEAGADTNKPDFKDDRPIMKVFYGNDTGPLEDHRRKALALLLRDASTQVNMVLPGTLNTPLHLAIRRRDAWAVGMLVYRDADVNAKNASGSTPLLLTAGQFQGPLTNEHARILEFLLEREGIAVDEKAGFNEQTALHYAVKAGASGAVEQLLGHNADPHCKDSEGRDALSLAMMHAPGQVHAEHVDIMLLLMTAMKMAWRSHKKVCLLDTACKDAQGDLMTDLLSKGLDANFKKCGKPLLHMAVEAGNEKVVEVVTQRGGFADAKDGNGADAVIFAVAKREDGLARWLVKKGKYQKKSNRITAEDLEKVINGRDGNAP